LLPEEVTREINPKKGVGGMCVGVWGNEIQQNVNYFLMGNK
jgi:hypothetical protein